MNDVDCELKQAVWSKFRRQQNVFLATAEGDQPRLRPVTLIRFHKRLFFATGSRNAKVRQIIHNPKAEFCLMFGRKRSRGTIRVECLAMVLTDKDIKADVYNEVPLFREFWKTPEDPSYTLIELRPVGFEYYEPGSRETIRLEP